MFFFHENTFLIQIFIFLENGTKYKIANKVEKLRKKMLRNVFESMTVDEIGVDKIKVGEMGSRQSGNKQNTRAVPEVCGLRTAVTLSSFGRFNAPVICIHAPSPLPPTGIAGDWPG